MNDDGDGKNVATMVGVDKFGRKECAESAPGLRGGSVESGYWCRGQYRLSMPMMMTMNTLENVDES